MHPEELRFFLSSVHPVVPRWTVVSPCCRNMVSSASLKGGLPSQTIDGISTSSPARKQKRKCANVPCFVKYRFILNPKEDKQERTHCLTNSSEWRDVALKSRGCDTNQYVPARDLITHQFYASSKIH
jgi:hypothetical protein